MGCLPLDQFLCWKLKIAVLVTSYYVIVTGSVTCLLEILDIADQASTKFSIEGGFKAEWRMHVWEGWLACNIVMVVSHLIMIAYSILMIFAIKRFPTYYEYNLTKSFMVVLICYTLIELGTSLYKYTWYGPNIFRLAFLVFSFMWWILRFLLNVVGIIIVYSRIEELDYEIQYGEKKMLNPYISRDLLADYARSGYATPLPPGMRGAPASGYAPSGYAPSGYAQSYA